MLSMKAKYALKALMILAENPEEQMQVKTIASTAHIPYKFLETILCELKKDKIVNSKRGANGGCLLAKPSRQIMVGDVIRLIDGPLAPIRCASMTAYQACKDCPDEHLCALHDVMRDVRTALSSVLDQRSIHDLSHFQTNERIKTTQERKT